MEKSSNVLLAAVLLTALWGGPVLGQEEAPASPPTVLLAGPADPAPADPKPPDPAQPKPAEQAEPKPAGDQPPAEPKPADAQDIQAKVVEVQGSVVHRSASKGGEFKPVVQGMTLPADTLVSVGPKGRVILTFGENSAVLLEALSVMTIAQVYKTRVADAETVVTRLKLINGSVRAGVERGRTQSDFKVSTAVATLSVRGTRPIRLFYNAGAGELWIYLGAEGRATGEAAGGGKLIKLTPGEGTNEQLIMALILAIYYYHVGTGDPTGQTSTEFDIEVFNPGTTGGFGGGDLQKLLEAIRQRIGGHGDSCRGDSMVDDSVSDCGTGDCMQD